MYIDLNKFGSYNGYKREKIKPAFKSDWDRLLIIELGIEVWRFVDRIIARHALKAADSIHLSTALMLKQTLKTEIIFFASDIELLAAAQKEKLKIINPVLKPDSPSY